MKKVTLFVSLAFLSISCSKKDAIEPINNTTTQHTPLASNRKFVEIYITYGGVNNFCSVKWAYNPDIDSGYTSTNTNSRDVKCYTESDSIHIYTNSYAYGQQQSNTVLVVVDGIVKTQYSGIQQERLIKLK